MMSGFLPSSVIMTDHLLRPSLTKAHAVAPLYSPRSSFLLGFFLGPLPLILYSALNSIRLRRTADLFAYALALAAFMGLVYASFMDPLPQPLAWINGLFGESTSMRGAARVLAILLWCGFYLMHRKEHRATDLLGDRPSPWRAAIACAVLGSALVFGIYTLFAAFA